MSQDIDIIIKKLDAFIRKYYANLVIKGVIISATVISALMLTFAVSEYFGYFSSAVRTFIFYTLSSIFAISFIFLILIPLLKIYKIGKIISYKEASRILAKHFDFLEDKLENTLELASLDDYPNANKELLLASIKQRTETLKPVPFKTAVSFKTGLKYSKYLGVVVALGIAVFMLWPAALSEGTERIVNFDKDYEPKAPFNFELLNKELTVQKGKDFEVKLSVTGEFVPQKVFIEYGGNKYLMPKNSNSSYTYTFKGLSNDINFKFYGSEYYSRSYGVKVLPAPIIPAFLVEITPPTYTDIERFKQKNTGDISCPAGSKIKWQFNTIDTDVLNLIFNDSIKHQAQKDSSGFSFSKAIYSGGKYKITAGNKYFKDKDFLTYFINVIPDISPGIKVRTEKDSASLAAFYFNGFINDDYGFTKLTFNYSIFDDDTSQTPESTVTTKLDIAKGVTGQEFFYAFDFFSLKGQQGKRVEYYFEVWDNDMINGFKSTRSHKHTYKIPDDEEIDKMTAEADKAVQDNLEKSKSLSEDMKKDLERLQEDLLNKNMSNWERSQMMEEFTQKQKQLEQMLKKTAEENMQKNQLKNNLDEKSQEILDKQKQIEELLKNLMTDELQKMIDELNELMQEYDKNQLNEMAEDMKMSYDELSEELDKNLELLKRFEVEEKVNDAARDLEKLAQEHQELAEKVENKEISDQEALEEQKKHEEAFDKAMEKYKEAQEKNENLEKPFDLNDFKQDKQDVKSGMQKSKENISKSKSKKASKQQKQDAQKMDEMAQNMDSMMQQNMMQQAGENMEDLQQLLENIITFSFSQEHIMQKIEGLNRRDPKYNFLSREQSLLNDNFKQIKDSLNALARREPQINALVSEELLTIEKHLKKVSEAMEERQTGASRISQQVIMTSANNLALLMSEILKSMQQQMANQMQGNQQCQKPGSSSPSMSQMKQQQQSLKSQIESMIEQLKGEKGKGKGNKQDKNALNKKLSQMMAQQEIFNNMLEEMLNKNGLSPEAAKKLREIKDINDKNLDDIINRNITNQTLKRQEQILTRLLEAENSEYQRETEKKRESKEAKDEIFDNPERFFQQKRLNSRFNELLMTSKLKLTKYYKDKYKEYLIKLNEENTNK